MPWKVREGGEDCPFEVVKEDSGEHVACHPTREKAQAHVRALYANEPSAAEHRNRAPVELRDAAVGNVNFPERIISLIAAPYEQPTLVPYRGEMWHEVLERNAFNGIERKQKLRVNRDHDRSRTVGKVLGYFPDRPEGLVIDAYISSTILGDETLQLAADDALSGSVGMAVRPSDQILDRRSRTRRIKRAFLDHLALVPDPAYEGAEIIGVRDPFNAPEAGLPKLSAPAIDDYWSDPIFKWAQERLEQRADKKPYGDVSYADPGYQDDNKKRYPIDTADHCRAAWSYVYQESNARKYTAEQLSSIKGRIRAAAKRFEIDISDD